MATERIQAQGSLAALRKLPVRKLSARYTTRPPARMPEFEMIKPSNHTTSVVVAITEEANPVYNPPEAPPSTDPPQDSKPRVRPQPPPLAIPQKARLPPPKPEPSSPSHPEVPAPPPERSQSAADVALPPSNADTPASAGTPAMRSMFPTYNHTVPLSRQDYRPNAENVPETTFPQGSTAPSSNNPYRNGMSASRSNVALSVPPPTDPKESPLRRSESLKRADVVSTPEQLSSLWDIANGQAYEAAEESYTLELSCDDLTLDKEIINFSSTDALNVYTLAATAKPSAMIQTSRTNPTQTGTRIPTCISTVLSPSRQDPLVCSIFPKLAGLLALDQSSTEAVSKGLDRAASKILQTEAINRAQEKESSMLLWDADSGRYCVLHPTLLDNSATTLPIEITPNPTSPSQIVIYAPETHTALLTLNLQSLALKIHAQAITALPSLYIFDTLMTALLSLLLHLHRSCGIPRTVDTSPPAITQQDLMPYFPPPPPSIHSRSSSRNRSRSRRTTNNRNGPQRSRSQGSLFRSNRSVRSAAGTIAPSTPRSGLVSPTFPPTHHSYNAGHGDRDIELGDLSPDGTSLSTLGKATSKSGNGKVKPPKRLFDIEDESLPGGTRAVLKFLYWVFEVVFWLLGLMVQVLAAGVVAGGKLVTKL